MESEETKNDKTKVLLDVLFNGMLVVIFAVLLIAMIVYSVSNTNEKEQLKDEIGELRTAIEKMNGDLGERIDSVDNQINTLIENDKAHTQQIEGLTKNNESIDKLIKDVQTKIKEMDKHIDEVEEAKAEKKAAEQAVITASYEPTPAYNPPTGGCLTPSGGVHNGPSGLETYYNLPMDGVIEQARNFGIEGEYWVRDDGVKMYGDYVILACNRDVHPMGTLVETSLGTGISLDTGGFAESNPTQCDVAVSW
jgi:septal ring factor EnvC (AmiA/AmiB activator)